MIITKQDIDNLILATFQQDPPQELLDYCGKYYAPYYHFMYLLALVMKPTVAVELGVEKGRGSLALALSGATVVGVESQPRVESAYLNKFSNYTFLHAPSMPLHPSIPEEIDLLHIDTEHSYAMAWEEFKAYKSRLSNRAVVLFDDTHATDDGVLHAMKQLPYTSIECDELHPGCGYGVLLYNR